jgi:hypothetical protein
MTELKVNGYELKSEPTRYDDHIALQFAAEPPSLTGSSAFAAPFIVTDDDEVLHKITDFTVPWETYCDYRKGVFQVIFGRVDAVNELQAQINQLNATIAEKDNALEAEAAYSVMLESEVLNNA